MLDEFIREIYDRLPKDLFSFCQLIGVEHDELGQLLKSPHADSLPPNQQKSIDEEQDPIMRHLAANTNRVVDDGIRH